MLELRELDLQLAFFRAGALGENIQDQRGAIEHLALEDLFQVARLRRRKFIVEDDRIDFIAPAMLGEFVRLAGADVSAREDLFQFLRAVAEHVAAGRGCKFAQFVEGILSFAAWAGL